METGKGFSLAKEHPSFENLIPLLINEHNRRECSNQYASTKEQVHLNRHNNEPVSDLNYKNPIHEKNLDLVINVELQRKQKRQYMDAYYTDFDLHGRKLYHETISKTKPNKTKFADLSLLFTKDLNKTNKKRQTFGIDDGTSSHDRRDTFGSKQGMTIAKSNNKVYKCGISDEDRLVYKPTDSKQLKSWMPLHYQNIPRKVYGKQYKITDDLNKTPYTSTQFNHNESKNEKLNKKQICHFNQTPRKHNLTLLPLAVDASTNDTLNNTPTKEKENQPKSYIKYNKESSIEAVGVSLSDSQLDTQRSKTKQNDLDCKQFPMSIEYCNKSSVKSNLMRQQTESDNQTTKPVSTHPNTLANICQANICEQQVNNAHNNGIKAVVFQENSSISETISSTAVIENNFIKFTDITYMNQKYHREIQRSFLEKENKSDIFKMNNSSLLKFDLDNMLNNVCSNIQRTDYFTKELNSNSSQMKNAITNEAPLPLSNTDELKKKIVEVIFPVKSLRKCVDIKTSKSSEECYTTDMSLVENGSGSSKIEIEITGKTVVKNTEIITEDLVCSDNPMLTKTSSRSFNIQLFKSTFITKTDCSNTNSKEKDKTPIKTLLDSDDFRSVVLNIIEEYLKNNYLKDDNFDVIIVPKRNDLSKNPSMMEALRKVINHSCHSDQDSDYKIYPPDLSSFNPRDFKGHEIKYNRNLHCEAPMRTNNIPKKKSLRYERIKRRIPSIRTNKLIETKDIEIEKINKELNKYLSMPVVKLKSIKTISNQSGLPYMKTKQHSLDLNEESYSVSDDVEQFTSTLDTNIPKYSKHETPPNKSFKAEKQNKTKLFKEFNEFKSIFHEVECEHNRMIRTFDFDPCGLLFKVTKYNIVTKPKR